MDLSESTLLTIIGMCGSGFSVLLIYFLKSRCSSIKMCGCIHCDREVLPEVEATVSQSGV